jgi:capsular exopolysaccharide synthesis family protein
MASLPQTEGEQTRLVERTEVYGRMTDRLREQLQEAQIEEAVEVGQVEIVDLAELPTMPVGMSRKMKLAIGLLTGLLLGGGGAYVIENATGVIRRKEDLEAALQVPTLTLVPPIRLRSSSGHRGSQEKGSGKPPARYPKVELITISNLRSTGAEAYRMLRTNLLFSASAQRLRRIAVTSAGPREGKTTTSANLAVTFAQQGHRVLLVDCDLHRARLHRLFRIPRKPGLTEVLLGQHVAAEAIKSTPVERLFVLPAGASLPSPSELLGSVQMRNTLDALSETFDLIILDTPPLCFASDAAIVSKLADGVVILVRAGRTERAAAQQAIQQLTAVGARVLGAVFNDPDAEAAKYGGYYPYYGYSYY